MQIIVVVFHFPNKYAIADSEIIHEIICNVYENLNRA